MSHDPIMLTARGVTAPVVHPAEETATGKQGIAIGRAETDTANYLVVSIRHDDGTMLSCMLDAFVFAKWVEMLERTADEFFADVRGSRFGEHE